MKIRNAMILILLVLPLQAQEPPKAPAKQEEKVQVNFMAMELDVVAQQVERATKKSFLFQDQLLKGKKVTLKSETPIGPDEFYRVFQSICHMHGLVLVPVKGEKLDLVKIVPAQQGAKEPGIQPVLAKGEALPSGETLVYYVLVPKHLSPTKAMPVVTAALSSIGALHQVPNTDFLLIIDVASSIARIEKLLTLLDLPGEEIITSVVAFLHTDASKAKSQLTEFFQALDKMTSGETTRERVALLLDERLNQITLLGTQREVKRAEEFLKQQDRELSKAKVTTAYYRLKNVPVIQVTDTLRQLLGLTPSFRETSEGSTGAKGSPVAGKPVKELSGAPQLPPTVTPPGKDESMRRELSPGVPAGGDPAPRRELLGASGGEVQLVPLESLNTLVVTAPQATHDEIKGILENLDKRKGQVLIEVAIMQVTGDDSFDFGFEALREGTKNNGTTTAGGSGFGLGTQADTNASGFPDTQNLSGFTGGAFRYLRPGEVSVLFKALSTRSNVNILSQPLLVVSDNEGADFTTKVSEPTIAVSQGTVGNITAFAGFAEAATTLKITPQISPEGYLNLKITQNFEEFTGSSGSSGVPPPKVSNSVTTMITVPDRHTAILGGFTRDSATDTRTGIPILMDIPLIGSLASQTTLKVTKSRLYLFVRPSIFSSEGFSDLKATSKDKLNELRTFTTGSRIEPAVKKAFAIESGPDLKEVPLPFGEERK